MKRIHLDHNATTPMRPEAREALLEALDAGFGNASSVHDSGRRARSAIDEARERIAGALRVDEDAVVFTSGGTESNNLAILGVADTIGRELRVVTSRIEHAAVLEPIDQLRQRGFETHQIDVDARGAVDLDALSRVVSAPARTLVSLMAANNEVGSTVDLGEVRRRIGPDAIFHSDAVQALGKRHVDLAHVDLATLSAHKVGGPVGVGILIRQGAAPLVARTFGGAQEATLRPGTENAAAILSASVAIERAAGEVAEYATRTAELTEALWRGLSHAIPEAVLNGPPIDDPTRLPNTLNVSLPSGDARTLVVRLDLVGVEVSAGSACASGSIEPSHVLHAMGIGSKHAATGVRMSLGRTTSMDDIHTAVERLRTTLGNPS